MAGRPTSTPTAGVSASEQPAIPRATSAGAAHGILLAARELPALGLGELLAPPLRHLARERERARRERARRGGERETPRRDAASGARETRRRERERRRGATRRAAATVTLRKGRPFPGLRGSAGGRDGAGTVATHDSGGRRAAGDRPRRSTPTELWSRKDREPAAAATDTRPTTRPSHEEMFFKDRPCSNRRRSRPGDGRDLHLVVERVEERDYAAVAEDALDERGHRSRAARRGDRVEVGPGVGDGSSFFSPAVRCEHDRGGRSHQRTLWLERNRGSRSHQRMSRLPPAPHWRGV